MRVPKNKGGGNAKSPGKKSPAAKGGKSSGGGGAGKDGGDKDASKWKAGDWACAKCGAHNFRGKDTCFRCKYARANSVKAASAESAWDYLTKFAVDAGKGDWEQDPVQHLWLAKHVYGRDVNNACFDLYMPYVESLDNKQKLRLLEGAKLAVARATQMVEALKDTPEEKKQGDGGKKEVDKKSDKGGMGDKLGKEKKGTEKGKVENGDAKGKEEKEEKKKKKKEEQKKSSEKKRKAKEEEDSKKEKKNKKSKP